MSEREKFNQTMSALNEYDAAHPVLASLCSWPLIGKFFMRLRWRRLTCR